MTRPLLRFVVLTLAVYICLILLWPMVRDAFSGLYRGVGNSMFASIGENVSVSFRPATNPDDIMDTEMILRNRKVPDAYAMRPVSIRYDAYVPMSLVVALVLASPVSWRRRLPAMFWALLLVALFVVVRRWISIMDGMSEGDAVSAYAFSPLLKGCLKFIVRNLLGSIILCTYIVPIIIWIVVLLRRQDWERLQPRPNR